MSLSLALCICAAIAGIALVILLSVSVNHRSTSTPAARELSQLPQDAERQVIQRIANNPSLYSSYLAFDLFVENFRGVDDLLPSIRIEKPYPGSHDSVLIMVLKRFHGLSDSIFGKTEGAIEIMDVPDSIFGKTGGANDDELGSVKRWIREGTTSVADDGLSIVVRSPLFHETRSVLFDARLWLEEFVNREGDREEVSGSGFSISARGNGVDVPSNGIMMMGPGSFNLEFKLRYDASRAALRVASARVTPGAASDFFFDLRWIDQRYLRTRSMIELVSVFDPAQFSPYIHQRLADAMQAYMNRIFSKA